MNHGINMTRGRFVGTGDNARDKQGTLNNPDGAGISEAKRLSV